MVFTESQIHKPVLQKEVLEYLKPNPNENFIDCTVGEGGHTAEILKKNGPKGKVLGIDWDKEQIANLRLGIRRMKNLEDRIILVDDSYVNLKKIVEKNNFNQIKGILLDLGMSSWHLEKSGRGFSFQKDEPLDMRYNITFLERSPEKCYMLTAEEIVNQWSESEVERILKEYGEERFAGKIAKEIVRERGLEPIKTTLQLVEIIKKAIPKRYQHGRIHFATRTFQALRIAVNDELNNLKKVLPQISEVLGPGGRIVIISFHSLEDRIVKNFFKNTRLRQGYGGQAKLKNLTKKPIIASEEERKDNPRSRSAKLRAALKI